MIVGQQINLIGHAYDALRCAPIGSDGFENTAEHLLELVAELWMDRHKQTGPKPGDGFDWWAVNDRIVILRRVQ